MEPLIQANQLQRRYGSRIAVDGLDIELRRSDILGFLGPNGAGKSTTMAMLTGNLAPQGGTIRIAGIDLLEQPLAAKRSLGYLPETPPLYKELTVDEYLTYAARLHAIPRPRLAAALDQAKERCGLGEVGRRLIGNLSKGYQQRVGIAQAIIHQPMVIVLDEPTVGLDPNQIREIRRLIRELGEAHGVILSTHILPEVQSVCSRVQIIHEGRTVYSAPLDAEGDRVLRVGFDRPPTLERLAALAGITRAEALEDGRFLIWPAAEIGASALAEALVAAGWGLNALIPEQRSLEQVFVELTTGELAP